MDEARADAERWHMQMHNMEAARDAAEAALAEAVRLLRRANTYLDAPHFVRYGDERKAGQVLVDLRAFLAREDGS